MATLTLNISEKALATITAAAIDSVPGTVRVSRRASRDLPRVDVQLNEESHAASVEAFIGVQWPSPVSEVTQAVIDTVTQWLSDFAGVTTKKVTVVVDEMVRGNRVHSTRVPATPITIKAQAPHHAPKEVSVPQDADWRKVREPRLRRIRHSSSISQARVTQAYTGTITPVQRRDIGQFAKEPQIRHKNYRPPRVGVIGTPSWKQTVTPHILQNQFSAATWAPQVPGRKNLSTSRKLRTQWSRNVTQPQARPLPVWKPKANRLKVVQPQVRPLAVWEPQINPLPMREVRLPQQQPLRRIEIRPVTAKQLKQEADYA